MSREEVRNLSRSSYFLTPSTVTNTDPMMSAFRWHFCHAIDHLFCTVICQNPNFPSRKHENINSVVTCSGWIGITRKHFSLRRCCSSVLVQRRPSAMSPPDPCPWEKGSVIRPALHRVCAFCSPAKTRDRGRSKCQKSLLELTAVLLTES